MGKTLVGYIDCTPDMLKSKQGRVLVQEAVERLERSIGTVAHTLVQEIDDMEYTSSKPDAMLERAAAFVRVREAVAEWSKAGSDYALTLGGINPTTRKRYGFTHDAPRVTHTEDEKVAVALNAYDGTLVVVGAGARGSAMAAALRAVAAMEG